MTHGIYHVWCTDIVLDHKMPVVGVCRGSIVPAVVLEDEMMDRKEALQVIEENLAVDYGNLDHEQTKRLDEAIDMAIGALKAQAERTEERTETHTCDYISRQAAIDFIDAGHLCNPNEPRWSDNEVVNFLKSMPSAQPDQGKYEYHYDHTDCIWYRPEARNRCPVTCAQYRDGWNDAMNYIFRDGKGYRPYIRGKQYEE